MLAVFAVTTLVISRSGSVLPTPSRAVVSKSKASLISPTIYASDSKLEPLAQLLADEIQAKTNLRPVLIGDPHKAGIILKFSHQGAPESYRIAIDHRVTLSARTLQGLTWGEVTLLQAAQANHNWLKFKPQEIIDQPAKPYRGLMIDVARRYHSIKVLEQCVELCHLYKLNYLQLHLSDDQAFTFPSTAYPQINASNQHGGPSYSLAELKSLVRFADLRGVTIIPEMDIPGHSATLNRTMPELFKIKGTKPYEHHATINFANPKVLNAVDTLIGEMCEVFQSSPFFHMGGDEADIALVDQHPDFQALFQKLGLPNHSQQELFRRFIGQVDGFVKKRGKKLMVWEGFGRDKTSKFPIPKDVLVMEFENAYYLPGDLLADGYQVINASWTPLYVVNRHVWPAEQILNWNPTRFGRFTNLYRTAEFYQVPPTTSIRGAQICSWEGPEESEIQNLRRIVPAMAEKTWSHQPKTLTSFTKSLAETDALLGQLIEPVTILNSPLDAKDPNGFDVPCFTAPLTITLKAHGPGAIRFTLDGTRPSPASPVYQHPLKLDKTTTVRAILGEAKEGYESAKTYYYVPPKEPNLAFGKKVTVSGGTQYPQTPDLVVDDNLVLASSWWASPAPQWLQIDLAKPYPVDKIEVFPYWDGVRYYQYTVEVSLDGQTWSVVADRSQNTTPSTEKGDIISIKIQTVRYVRVNMIRGSANEGVHLVEVRVHEAKP